MKSHYRLTGQMDQCERARPSVQGGMLAAQVQTGTRLERGGIISLGSTGVTQLCFEGALPASSGSHSHLILSPSLC